MIVCVFLRPYFSWLPSDEPYDAAAEHYMRTFTKCHHTAALKTSLFQEDAGTVQQQPVDTFWPSLQGYWGINVQI